MSSATVSYPMNRAIRLAHSITRTLRLKHPELVRDERCHDSAWLISYCKRLGIRIRMNEEVPAGAEAAALSVGGVPFIVVGRDASRNQHGPIEHTRCDAGSHSTSPSLAAALAHELAHVLLGHLERPSVAYAFHAWIDEDTREDLRQARVVEAELLAELASMMILVPDGFIDQVIEKYIFFPVRKVASEETPRFSTPWMAARVQLYRQVHGYERSQDLLRHRQSDNIFRADYRRWFDGIELSTRNWLEEQHLPKVSANTWGLLQYVTTFP